MYLVSTECAFCHTFGETSYFCTFQPPSGAHAGGALLPPRLRRAARGSLGRGADPVPAWGRQGSGRTRSGEGAEECELGKVLTPLTLESVRVKSSVTVRKVRKAQLPQTLRRTALSSPRTHRPSTSPTLLARSLAELVAALDRKHCCACSHPLHEAAKCQARSGPRQERGASLPLA